MSVKKQLWQLGLLCFAEHHAWAAPMVAVDTRQSLPDVVIHANQVAYDAAAPKVAVVETSAPLPPASEFHLLDAATKAVLFKGKLGEGQACADWFLGKHFYRADFSKFKKTGQFELAVAAGGWEFDSAGFAIGKWQFAAETLPAILGFYQHQRANSPAELEADQHLILYGKTNTVDLRGGWCDASGDVSKYFSHLAYANFMSPQQTPNVVWSGQHGG